MKKGATTWWVICSSTYTVEALRKVYAPLKFATFQKDKLPSSPGDHPDVNIVDLFSSKIVLS